MKKLIALSLLFSSVFLFSACSRPVTQDRLVPPSSPTPDSTSDQTLLQELQTPDTSFDRDLQDLEQAF